jgi:hypothetical protein
LSPGEKCQSKEGVVEILSFYCDTGGKTMKEPAPLQETMSEAPPPKIVPKAFAGRIRPEWKGNGK